VKHGVELTDRLYEHWHRTGLTIAVEAAAEIGSLIGMVTLAEQREAELRKNRDSLDYEVRQLHELVRRLFHERNSARHSACEAVAAGSRGALSVEDVARQMGWNLREAHA